VNYFLFAVITLVCVFPFYYLFINTVSNNQASNRGEVIFYPVGFHLTNYYQVLRLHGLLNAALVSLGRTVIGTTLTVLSCALLGYLFTKNQMWGRKFWYRFLMITMYFNAGIIPWYITMYNLGLTNNFLAYVLPTIVSPFYVILVKTFVESTPVSLQESAEIDGAGYIMVFSRIILPLIQPILATIAVFAAVGQWNSFIDTVFLITKQELFTLQFVLFRYLNQASALAALIRNTQGTINIDVSNMQTETSVRMTVSMIVVIPVLFVYPYFQRFFIKGIMIGAVKG
jgi:putative aldouronate transport system permease protein